jgi:sulfite exporter TauE/SafE
VTETITLTFAAALLLGLSFGAGPCNIACLPYLGPVFLGSNSSISSSWRIILPFSLGRISGYSLLGLLAGMVGAGIENGLDSGGTRLIQGGAILLVAFALLIRRQKGDTCKPPGNGVPVEFSSTTGISRGPDPSLPAGLFLVGAGMALNPCIPLTTIILAAAATGSGLSGALLGLAFGLGAALLPALLFGIGVAHLSREIRHHLTHWLPRLEQGSIALLFVLGVGTVTGWITL